MIDDSVVDLSHKDLEFLPTSLPEKSIIFNCAYNKLSNLSGSSSKVNRYFCHCNLLTDLIGSPNEVSEDFDCSHNNLTDLIGSPNYVGGFFSSNYNNLKTLNGLPKIIKTYLSIIYNPNLLDLSDVWVSDIETTIYFHLNPGMAILPLIKIYRLICKNDLLISIHKRNRGSSKQNIIDFQYDLIENGYEENAKWKP